MLIHCKLIRPSLSLKIRPNHPIFLINKTAGFSTYTVHRNTSSSILTSKLNNLDLLKQKAYVNSEWVDSTTSRTFTVNDPATGEEIGTCPDMNVEDLHQAILAAKQSFSKYKSTTAQDRRETLKKFNDLILKNASDLASIIVAENGKSFNDAMGEVKYAASFVDWFADQSLRTDGTIIPSSNPSIRHLVVHQPIGLVAAICPWNFPAAMITRKIAPAIAAGCTVIVKAPAETPLTALALAELSHQAGFPAGVVNIITSKSDTIEIGKSLCESEDIRKLSFTGSTGTCVSANRFYIHKSIYAEFATKLTQKVSELKVGSGFEPDTNIGPLLDEKSLKKVMRHVELAQKSGAEILIGGKKVDGMGFFFQPTVLSDVPSGVIDGEETFGPVAALYKFETEQEVINLANNSDVGLAGYFYSKDIGRIWRVAEALEVGMVGANTGVVSNSVTPFGGIKHSGFGREGSKIGIDEYQFVKYIAMGGL
ncbi:hypothetical protein H4Q26_017400 [Puccinia striiformis f. sp. tritici PST-130]|nr:hypothetical protein H4Q26_017400 [Puccinia striiformis f. sp. tritici PST-130]